MHSFPLNLIKVPGMMKLVSMLLKHVLDLCISHYFIYLTNPYKVEIFPDKLKIARVTPSFKKRSDSELGSYRPISVLPYFSKIPEKIIYNRLNKHLKEKEKT